MNVITPTVPVISPHDVHVTRLTATIMNVSFTRLSIVEAKSVNVVYTVRFASHKRLTPDVVVVNDGQSYMMITDLDPHSEYSVRIVVSANGQGSVSENVTVPILPGIIM